MNSHAIVSDLKKLLREPLMLLFMVVPFLAIAAVKALLIFGTPLLVRYTGFDLTPYLGYIEGFMVLLSPGMLGAVTAFMMIDERDGGIYTLMSVTPIGFSGYIANRLVMPFVLSMAYTLISHLILNLVAVSAVSLFAVMLLSGLQAISTALVLFSIADDKVKGLTLAKMLDSLMITSAADLLGIPWVSVLSGVLPFYWTTKFMIAPQSAGILLLGIAVNAAWVGIALMIADKRR